MISPGSMLRRVAVSSLGLFIAVPLLLSAQTEKRGRKYTPPPPTCKITVIVTKGSTGKPVENAGVVFHPIDKDGKDGGNMELKTNEEGKAELDVIPVGDTVRLQIIAHGFQTYGADYVADTTTKEIAVKMLPPGHQYSIYEKHNDSQRGGEDEAPKPSDDSAQPH